MQPAKLQSGSCHADADKQALAQIAEQLQQSLQQDGQERHELLQDRQAAHSNAQSLYLKVQQQQAELAQNAAMIQQLQNAAANLTDELHATTEEQKSQFYVHNQQSDSPRNTTEQQSKPPVKQHASPSHETQHQQMELAQSMIILQRLQAAANSLADDLELARTDAGRHVGQSATLRELSSEYEACMADLAAQERLVAAQQSRAAHLEAVSAHQDAAEGVKADRADENLPTAILAGNLAAETTQGATAPPDDSLVTDLKARVDQLTAELAAASAHQAQHDQHTTQQQAQFVGQVLEELQVLEAALLQKSQECDLLSQQLAQLAVEAEAHQAKSVTQHSAQLEAQQELEEALRFQHAQRQEQFERGLALEAKVAYKQHQLDAAQKTVTILTADKAAQQQQLQEHEQTDHMDACTSTCEQQSSDQGSGDQESIGLNEAQRQHVATVDSLQQQLLEQHEAPVAKATELQQQLQHQLAGSSPCEESRAEATDLQRQLDRVCKVTVPEATKVQQQLEQQLAEQQSLHEEAQAEASDLQRQLEQDRDSLREEVLAAKAQAAEKQRSIQALQVCVLSSACTQITFRCRQPVWRCHTASSCILACKSCLIHQTTV